MSSATVSPLVAAPDVRLRARVVRRTPLFYLGGADPALDRPAHVRAGSGVAWFGARLVVVQDDANFLAFVDPRTGETRAVPLPAGEDGRRQFGDGRGNKHHKLDLEAVFSIPGRDGGWELVALGSGSTPRREQIITATGRDETDVTVTVCHAHELYAALRADPEFAPGELNVEGAVYLDGTVRLFGRGNGAAREGRSSRNAVGWVVADGLHAYLRGGGPVPHLANVQPYELGRLDDLALGFTDATVATDGHTVLFAAAAEDSPDATRDGRVAGSALGVLDPGGTVRWTPLVGASDAESFVAKVEGIVATPGDAYRLFAVIDLDDPDAPSELCEVVLEGPWYGMGDGDPAN